MSFFTCSASVIVVTWLSSLGGFVFFGNFFGNKWLWNSIYFNWWLMTLNWKKMSQVKGHILVIYYNIFYGHFVLNYRDMHTGTSCLSNFLCFLSQISIAKLILHAVLPLKSIYHGNCNLVLRRLFFNFSKETQSYLKNAHFGLIGF